jgi:hypothetical protein
MAAGSDESPGSHPVHINPINKERPMYTIWQTDAQGNKRRLTDPLFTGTDEERLERLAIRLTFAGPRGMSYAVRHMVP